MKAVFDTRGGTRYKDDIVHRYHFPRNYLKEAERTLGDWIIYRVPEKRGGDPQKGYIAAARVTDIRPDPSDPSHFYAEVAGYWEFRPAVPFSLDSVYFEERLNRIPRSRVGSELQGRSVRTISETEFDAIARAGLSEILVLDDALPLDPDGDRAGQDSGLALKPQERRIEQILVNRKVRDAAFRILVGDAYDSRCAVTRLRIRNGGGQFEAQAAHIWPVAEGGPDVVQNGIMLSATCHWLFDRHLISLDDDYGLLVSHNKVPGRLRGLFDQRSGRIHLPEDESKWPRPEYVRRHREAFAGF